MPVKSYSRDGEVAWLCDDSWRLPEQANAWRRRARMRSLFRALFAFLGIMIVGCGRAPHFEFTDQTSITFTNRNPMQREGLVLGASSRASFIRTVTQPESGFDPKLLQLSAPMGVFYAGDTKFEYHLGLVVYRAGGKAHIWQSDFSRQLGNALLTTNASWKEILEK
jgi:hypothetical protein